MRTLTTLIVVGFFLLPGCTAFESEGDVEQDVVIDVLRGCTDENLSLIHI